MKTYSASDVLERLLGTLERVDVKRNEVLTEAEGTKSLDYLRILLARAEGLRKAREEFADELRAIIRESEEVHADLVRREDDRNYQAARQADEMVTDEKGQPEVA